MAVRKSRLGIKSWNLTYYELILDGHNLLFWKLEVWEKKNNVRPSPMFQIPAKQCLEKSISWNNSPLQIAHFSKYVLTLHEKIDLETLI